MRGAAYPEAANKRAAFLAANTNGKVQNSFLVVTQKRQFSW
jgi:hypothetical protein